MKRATAIDLLPLLAGDDLDPAQRAEVEAAIAGDAECMEELAEFEQLDGWLREAYSSGAKQPEWVAELDSNSPSETTPGVRESDAPLATADAQEQVPLLVRRQCPFCHDSLASEDVVFCTQCATPHHSPCFSEHHGCALLGCGGVESVATRSAASRLCAGCQGHTPANAPFCAWCGSTMKADGEPLHHRPKRRAAPALRGLRQFLTAAAVLIFTGVGVGMLFGRRELPVLATMQSQVYELWRTNMEEQARTLLRETVIAQHQFLAEDLDDDGVADYAESLDELTRCLKKKGIDGSRDLQHIWRLPYVRLDLEVSARIQAGRPVFCAVAGLSDDGVKQDEEYRARFAMGSWYRVRTGSMPVRRFSTDAAGGVRVVAPGFKASDGIGSTAQTSTSTGGKSQ
jgi:hypothetical protein